MRIIHNILIIKKKIQMSPKKLELAPKRRGFRVPRNKTICLAKADGRADGNCREW